MGFPPGCLRAGGGASEGGGPGGETKAGVGGARRLPAPPARSASGAAAKAAAKGKASCGTSAGARPGPPAVARAASEGGRFRRSARGGRGHFPARASLAGAPKARQAVLPEVAVRALEQVERTSRFDPFPAPGHARGVLISARANPSRVSTPRGPSSMNLPSGQSGIRERLRPKKHTFRT